MGKFGSTTFFSFLDTQQYWMQKGAPFRVANVYQWAIIENCISAINDNFFHLLPRPGSNLAKMTAGSIHLTTTHREKRVRIKPRLSAYQVFLRKCIIYCLAFVHTPPEVNLLSSLAKRSLCTQRETNTWLGFNPCAEQVEMCTPLKW